MGVSASGYRASLPFRRWASSISALQSGVSFFQLNLDFVFENRRHRQYQAERRDFAAGHVGYSPIGRHFDFYSPALQLGVDLGGEQFETAGASQLFDGVEVGRIVFLAHAVSLGASFAGVSRPPVEAGAESDLVRLAGAELAAVRRGARRAGACRVDQVGASPPESAAFAEPVAAFAGAATKWPGGPCSELPGSSGPSVERSWQRASAFGAFAAGDP